MSFYFPDAATIEQHIRQQPPFDMEYFQKKGITKAVAKLAAKRFADNEMAEIGIQAGIASLIFDLQTGVDGFTEEKFPLGKLNLSEPIWDQITNATQKALFSCAKKVD